MSIINGMRGGLMKYHELEEGPKLAEPPYMEPYRVDGSRTLSLPAEPSRLSKANPLEHSDPPAEK